MINAVVGNFDPGEVIHVCGILVDSGNPFNVTGPFVCDVTVKSVNAPFPGGGINGDQLMAVVHKSAGNKKIDKTRARALTVGMDAADPGTNMMTVDTGAGEFYNNYVVQDQQGRLVIFLDIEV